MATAVWSHRVCFGLFFRASFSCSLIAHATGRWLWSAPVTGADGSSVQGLCRVQAMCQAPPDLCVICDRPFGLVVSGQREGHSADFLSHPNLHSLLGP